MTEIENTDVIKEVVQPAEEEVVTEQQETSEEQPQKNSSEYNFKELRKKLEDSERAKREIEQRYHELAYASYKPQETQQTPVEDDLQNLRKDDWLTVEQAEKIALRKAEELLRQREVETLEDRVRMKFRDYDDVVSEENVLKLIEDDRELADTIRNSPNPYTAAYKLIKKSAFYKEAEDGKKYKTESVNMQKNAQKPVSSNAVAKPLASANTYATNSKAEMDSLYKEMMEYARRS